MQQRNIVISFVHTFGIVLVVLGHSFYAYNQVYDHNYLWEWRSFAMPLFMFMSGYLLKYTTRAKNRPLGNMTIGDIGKFLLKKAKRLLIPYVVISSIVFLPKSYMSRYALHPVEMNFASYVDMLVHSDNNVVIYFWFLPALFVIFCIVSIGAYCLKRLGLKVPPLVFLVGLLLLNIAPVDWLAIDILSIGKALFYMLYFASGYYFCHYVNIERFIADHRGKVLCVTFLISVAVLFLPYNSFKSLLLAYNGIVMSFAIAHIYAKRMWSFLNPYLEASFAIYLFSWFPQVAVQQVLLSFVQVHWLLDTILAVVTGFFVPYFVWLLIMRYKHTRVGRVVAFLTGQ